MTTPSDTALIQAARRVAAAADRTEWMAGADDLADRADAALSAALAALREVARGYGAGRDRALTIV